MIAPIREPSRREMRENSQRRKARRWIVESLLSRTEAKSRPDVSSAWPQWLCAAWIVFVALVYLIEMLSGYFGRG